MLKIMLYGAIVAESKNLRGALNYARKSNVTKVEVDHVATREGYPVKFTFHNGATCSTHFASDQVAVNWVLSRRSWGDSRKETHFHFGVIYKTTIHYL